MNLSNEPDYIFYQEKTINNSQSMASTTQSFDYMEDQDQYIDECNIQFTNLKEQKSCDIGQYDEKKKHLCVSPGLNLKGICRNPVCVAYNKRSWIRLGFGVFNIQTARFHNKCQSCGGVIGSKTIKTFGYTKAEVNLEGYYYQGEKQVPKSWRGKEQLGKFKYFDEGKSQIQQWGLIEMTVKKLR